MATKTQGLTWTPKLAKIKDIKPTPNNYKIKTDLGRQRLQQSMKSFGTAGTVICNWGTKAMSIKDLMLIDGNSRIVEEQEKGKKDIWVSVPSRMLTVKEFEEMSAMFDYAVAGKVDIERIQKEKGTSKQFYDKWGMEMPFDLLEKMGSKADMNGLEYPSTHKKGRPDEEEEKVKDIKMVQIFFTVTQEEQFRKWEVELRKRLKVKTTTDVIYKIVEQYCKTNKIK